MPPTLGQKLKHAREERGLSLEDVSHETRIPVPRLKDLEDDSFTTFGSLTYTRSHLKAYSQLLGVDAGEIMDQLPTPPLGGARDYEYLTRSYGPWIRKRSVPESSKPTRQTMPQNRSMIIVTVVSASVFVMGVGLILANAWFSDKETPKKAEEQAVVKAIPVVDEEVVAANKKAWETNTDEEIVIRPAQPAGLSQPSVQAPAELFPPPVKAVAVEEDPPAKKRKKSS